MDGIRGDATKKAGIKVVQHAMNHGLQCRPGRRRNMGREIRGCHRRPLHQKGETQYMVTALEILFMLRGIECGGVESPVYSAKDFTMRCMPIRRKEMGSGQRIGWKRNLYIPDGCFCVSSYIILKRKEGRDSNSLTNLSIVAIFCIPR